MLEEYQHGEVRELRLARYPANTFDPSLVAQLTNRLRVASLEGSRAVVLSGSLGMFSAGLDVSMLIAMDWSELQRFMRTILALNHQLAVQPVPVVAAITGHCVSVAAVIAMFCDYRIMAEGNYKIGINDVTFGVCSGRVAYQGLRRLVGARYADTLLARGEFVEPSEALHIGLVDRLVALEQVIPSAIEYAQSFLKLPQLALYETRRIARADLVALCDEALHDDSEQLHKRWFSDEAQQGLRLLAARLSKE